MPSPVERFRLHPLRNSGYQLVPDPKGAFVGYPDYEKLEKELAEAKKKRYRSVEEIKRDFFPNLDPSDEASDALAEVERAAISAQDRATKAAAALAQYREGLEETLKRLADAWAVAQHISEPLIDEDAMEALGEIVPELPGLFSALDFALSGGSGCLDPEEWEAKRTAAVTEFLASPDGAALQAIPIAAQEPDVDERLGSYVRSPLAGRLIEGLKSREAEAKETLDRLQMKREEAGTPKSAPASPAELVAYTEKRIYRDAILAVSDTDLDLHLFAATGAIPIAEEGETTQ